MAKYNVKFSCGHEDTVELFGPNKERERKIAWYENNHVCPACYRAEQDAKNGTDAEEKRIKYSEYKNEYSHLKTKKYSYDKSDKTIVVYFPKTKEKEKEINTETLESLKGKVISMPAIKFVSDMISKRDYIESKYKTNVFEVFAAMVHAIPAEMDGVKMDLLAVMPEEWNKRSLEEIVQAAGGKINKP